MRNALLAAAVAAVTLALCGTADAAIVTIGPNLASGFTPNTCHQACTLMNTSPGLGDPTLTSPISGVIVRWHLTEGTTAGEYHLRVAGPRSGSEWFFESTGPAASTTGAPGIQTFPASIPIRTGEAIALDLSETASIGLSSGGSGLYDLWLSPPLDGSESASSGDSPDQVGFNAEVQPPPTIGSLGRTSGPPAGGSAVVVTGTDFENVSEVSFGSLPAAGYSVESESQVTATAPPGVSGESMPIAITTLAGTATSAQDFTYESPTAPTTPSQSSSPPPPSSPSTTSSSSSTSSPPPLASPRCVVPKLKGKKLKAARRAIRAADCKVGHVGREKRVKTRTGKVVKQTPRPGAVDPAGSKVAVRLG
jgi:hypothetical protein